MLKFMNNQGLHASTSIIGEFLVSQNYNPPILALDMLKCSKQTVCGPRIQYYIPNKATIKIAIESFLTLKKAALCNNVPQGFSLL